jgi:ABC-type lipopolysaccharide export system ATPase subunit
VLHLGTVVASGDADTIANDKNLRHYYLGLVQ